MPIVLRLIGRASTLSLVWLIAHILLFLWRVFEGSTYLATAKWIAASILIPLHPWVVAGVRKILPQFETFIGNVPPTHENAGIVLYPLLMGLIGLVGAMVVASMRARRPAEDHGFIYWAKWSLRRAVIFPFAFVITHVILFVWKALDSVYYLAASKWVAANILVPLHPVLIWVVGKISPESLAPVARSFLQSLEPTHQDSEKVFYPLIMAIIGFVIFGAWLLMRRGWKVFREWQEGFERSKVKSIPTRPRNASPRPQPRDPGPPRPRSGSSADALSLSERLRNAGRRK